MVVDTKDLSRGREKEHVIIAEIKMRKLRKFLYDIEQKRQ